MNNTLQETAYVPGMCNINKAEIAYRRKAGYVFAAITVLVTAIFLYFATPPILSIVLFLPAMIAILNMLQVRNRFCVMYASKGMQNATEGSDTAKAVKTEQQIADKKKANKMNLQAAGGAALYTLIVIALQFYIFMSQYHAAVMKIQ